jgi:hypothetical protein
MDSGTVMVVGAGRFGIHYPRVLFELSTEARFGLERLVITRTHLSAARQTAAVIARMPGNPFIPVLGIEVADLGQLEQALAQYRPGLICIAARDPQLGDSIHARYTPAALDYGAVLCEKPFSRADDRLAPAILRKLMQHPNAAVFGLHLPMVVVREAMLADGRLGPRLRSARRIEFIWEKWGHGSDLVADLALHPWSLIPQPEDLCVSGFKNAAARVEIDFETPHCNGRMILGGEGSFRGMRLDDLVLRFEFAGGILHILECTAGWPDILEGKYVSESESSILSVGNPLKQHICAQFEGRPIVNIGMALQSQLFLVQAADSS